MAIGIDVGGSDDPAAACFMRKFHGGEFHAEVRQFLTNSGYERAGQNLRDIYDEAIEDGSLILVTEAGDIDIEIANWAKLITSTCPIGVTLGGDEHGRVGAKQALEYHSGHTFVSVSQGSVTIGAALAALENLLVDMKLSRAPSALLDANVANAMIIETPSGLRRIGKKDGGLSGQGQMKIDGLAALIDALHLVNSTTEIPADISHWIA